MRNTRMKVEGRRMKSTFFKFILVSCILHLASSVVFASEGAEPAASFKDLLWPVINFAILVFILVKFGRKPISEFLKKRTELIEKSLKEAEEAKELAKKAFSEVQERLLGMDKEINNILESAKKAGEREKEALIAQGESLKSKIIEQAKANIEYELQKAKKAIKSEAALMALELAEKQIKEKLDAKGHEKLTEEYIQKIACTAGEVKN